MNTIFSLASLKRSSRMRTRKNSVSITTNNESLPYRSSSISSRRKTRPPPLQIIPELSENELVIDVSPTNSPATARPTQFSLQQTQPDSSRITLSAYTFSIDDALLMFGDDTLYSPGLSASSSTSDGASSEDVPATPGTEDEGDLYGFVLPIPRLRPKRVSIRPLQITKTRSMICLDDEDINQCFEEEGEKPVTFPSSDAQHGVVAATTVLGEPGQDFYAREFEDFISLSPVVPFHCPPARRDSLTLVEASPVVIDVPRSKFRGRSRHSKPLPLLPPITPPMSTFPLMFPLVQTSAHTSVMRRKRNIPPRPNSLTPVTPDEARPLPRMSLPLDVEDCILSEDDFDGLPHDSVMSEHPYRLALSCTPSVRTSSLPPAMLETPLSEMYDEERLPRSSTDSDSPRSSIDSTSSFTSSSTSNTPTSPTLPSFECPEFDDTHRLRSRWSSSTLATVAADPPRTGTLFSPLRNALGSRVRRVPALKILPQMPLPSIHSKNKRTTPSPPNTPSRLSTSSTSSSECESLDGSTSSRHRKPMFMFLRSA